MMVASFANAQTAYEHISNRYIYTFIDDLATLQIIEVNTAIKPYSRTSIASWLLQADRQKDKLSRQQKALLRIFMKEYSLEMHQLKKGKLNLYTDGDKISVHLIPPEVVWKDTLFRAILRPVYGFRYVSNANKSFYHSYGGAEAVAYAGTKWSGYASLRDNYMSFEPISQPLFFTQEQGGNYKIGVQGRSGAEYSEMRGGIAYTWNWGTFAFIKDHLQWGEAGNGSNILSGRTPSFPMIKLQLKPAQWLEFNYFHGWLVSQVIDSSRSYITSNGDFRGVFRQKYIAANMYTFKPLKNLHISVGNSIVYSDVPVQPAYLIPFFFFKSLDHTLNKGIDNQNSAMFLSLSSRQIRHLHLYGTVFIDEFSMARINDPARHNFSSYKGGLNLTGWPLADLSISAEYTRTTPMTYKHRVPSTTFESNQFNLGHYLRDNSEEVFLALRYSPFSTIQLGVSYTNAYHANDYQYVFGGVPVDQNPVLSTKTWSSKSIAFRAESMPAPNIFVFAEYTINDVKGYDADEKTATYYLNRFSPKYLHGKTNTLNIGFNIGF